MILIINRLFKSLKQPGLGPDYRRALIARAVSWTGSALTLVALPVLVFELTQSAAWTATLTIVETAPYLFFGIAAGVFADRTSRKWMMIWCAAVAALCTGIVPFAWYVGWLSLPLLLIVALCSGIALVFFDAAVFGLIPSLVEKENIPQATASAMSWSTLIRLIGPMLGGFLLTIMPPAGLLALDAVSFAVAALLLLGVSESLTPVRNQAVTWFSDLGKGLKFLWKHSLVRFLTILGAANSLIGGVVTALLVPQAVNTYAVSSSGGWMGFFFAALSVGALLSSVILPRLKASPSGYFFWGMLVSAAGILLWALSSEPVLGLIGLAVYQGGSSLVILNGISVRTQATPLQMQGRINSVARTVAWGGQPLGAALVVIFVKPEVSLLLIVASVAAVLTALIGGYLLHRLSKRDEMMTE
ncbi:MFS transporter [Psychromicrobium sp. YIM B11713]|uniref:MFS transporter n=1 Tax=Psychromicrobium sp. YIM B11713 TaxID=3145233 RepID=UPI00374F57B7